MHNLVIKWYREFEDADLLLAKAELCAGNLI